MKSHRQIYISKPSNAHLDLSETPKKLLELADLFFLLANVHGKSR
jgi:hypothetical protein